MTPPKMGNARSLHVVIGRLLYHHAVSYLCLTLICEARRKEP